MVTLYTKGRKFTTRSPDLCVAQQSFDFQRIRAHLHRIEARASVKRRGRDNPRPRQPFGPFSRSFPFHAGRFDTRAAPGIHQESARCTA